MIRLFMTINNVLLKELCNHIDQRNVFPLHFHKFSETGQTAFGHYNTKGAHEHKSGRRRSQILGWRKRSARIDSDLTAGVHGSNG
jgi:hypothetical protein